MLLRRFIFAPAGRAFVLGVATAFGAGPVPSLLQAQEAAYPRQRVMMVVPFPAGGPADTVGRILADALAPRLGQPIIVENRPGGGGSAAVAAVARAEPDGHTVLLSGEGPLSVVPALANPPYDAMTGLQVASVFAEGGCTVAAVHPSFAAKDLAGLIAQAKAASEPLTYASSGLGTPADTVAAELQQMTGIALKRVIYRGAAPAMTDLIAGHVPLMFPSAGAVAELIATGKLRGLAVTTKGRCKVLADVPTMTEQGVPLEAGKIWFGLFVPATTPAAAIDRLHREIEAIVPTADFAARLEKLTLEPRNHPTRASAAAYVRTDIEQWRLKAAGIPALR